MFASGKNIEKDAKYILGYKTYKKNRALLIELPQMARFVYKFEKKHCMLFAIQDKNMMEKSELIWNKVSDYQSRKSDKQQIKDRHYNLAQNIAEN